MKSIYLSVQTGVTPNCAICKWRGVTFLGFGRLCAAQGEKSTRDVYRTSACKKLYEVIDDQEPSTGKKKP